MHVHNTLFHSIDSDQHQHSILSSNVTAVVIYIPEGVRLTSDSGNYALTIPDFPNAKYIEVCVDGMITGSGGSNGGGIKSDSTVKIKVTTKNSSGTIRGGTSSDSQTRDALNGEFDISNSPRIFNF